MFKSVTNQKKKNTVTITIVENIVTDKIIMTNKL